MAFWIVFSKLTGDIYEASLGSQITVPLDDPEIETFRQLVDSDLQLFGLLNMKEVLAANNESAVLREVLKKLTLTEMDIDVAVDEMANVRKMAYVRHRSTFTYYILENSAKGKLNILKECAYEYYPVFALQRNSPLANRMNQVLSIVFESGIGNYWESSFLYEEPEDVLEFKPFNINQSIGIFTLLLIGHAIALPTFIAEVGTGLAGRRQHGRKRKRKTRNRYR
ncbi:UNVERIFIED_CONTAM: hypothetical protein PYX00_000650 [Menopon gallinae]|uniref:Uncharacterized protein n=1 Tax=Menopon gallinae TaxID=328185 RepID=A0AAW2I9E9_9NEOP